MSYKPESTKPQSLSTIINMLESNIPRKLNNRVYHLRGKYVEVGTKQYGRHFYDSLHDEIIDSKITLAMPASLRTSLEDQSIYTFTGSFIHRVKKSPASVEFQFEVSHTSERQAPRLSDEHLERIKILKHKNDTGFKDPTTPFKVLLLENRKVNIALIYGETAIVHTDLRNALGTAINKYDFTQHTIKITDQLQLAKAISKADQSSNYDAIAVIRGGGSNLEIYDDIPLARQASQCKTPLITAIGHAQDTPFLQQIADKSFDTPTALGNWLRDLSEQTAKEQGYSYDLALRNIEQKHHKQLTELEARYKSQSSQVSQQQALSSQQQKDYQNQIHSLEQQLVSAKETVRQTRQNSKQLESSLKKQPAPVSNRPSWLVSLLIALATLIIGMMAMYITLNL